MTTDTTTERETGMTDTEETTTEETTEPTPDADTDQTDADQTDADQTDADESHVDEANADTDDETDEADQTEDDQADPAARARREAKKLRTRLRDAETERDELLTKLDALRRDSLARCVEREHRVNPKLLVSMEADQLADLFTPDGGIDADKVRERITTLADEYGLSRTPRPNPAQGSSGSGVPTPDGRDTWKEAFGKINSRR